jgi:GTP-binding protein HflX
VGSTSRRQRPSPATFFGRGQVEAAAARIAAAGPRRIFVNHALSGVQQRNLERAFGVPVLDRVALIIEIFSQRARTNEASGQDSAHCCCWRAAVLMVAAAVLDPLGLPARQMAPGCS